MVALGPHVGEFYDQVAKNFALHTETPLLDHRISQIDIDCRAEGPKIQRCRAELSNLTDRLLLGCRRARYQVRIAVTAREAACAGERRGGDKRRREALVGNRVEEQKIISNAIAATNHCL